MASLTRYLVFLARVYESVPAPYIPGLRITIVNLGTGYETFGISKAGTIQSQLDVEPTVTLHNLLFLVRKLISNILVEAFDWLSCRKKRAGSRPKKRTKT